MQTLLISLGVLLCPASASQYPGHVKDFHWTRPFPYDNTAPLHTETKCEITRTFRAEQWTLRDLRACPWHTAIETYTGWHSYPGSWEGADHGPQQREYLVMDWLDVPAAVRKWVDGAEHHRDRNEGTQGKWWMFGQFERPVSLRRYGNSDGNGTGIRDEDKVLLFAPAVMYEILPLWVAEGSECEGNIPTTPISKTTRSRKVWTLMGQQLRCWISRTIVLTQRITQSSLGPLTIKFRIQSIGRRTSPSISRRTTSLRQSMAGRGERCGRRCIGLSVGRRGRRRGRKDWQRGARWVVLMQTKRRMSRMSYEVKQIVAKINLPAHTSRAVRYMLTAASTIEIMLRIHPQVLMRKRLIEVEQNKAHTSIGQLVVDLSAHRLTIAYRVNQIPN